MDLNFEWSDFTDVRITGLLNYSIYKEPYIDSPIHKKWIKLSVFNNVYVYNIIL